MKTGIGLAACIVVGLTSAVGTATAAGSTGEQWDYAMTMEMAGMKMPLPATKVCATPEEGNAPPVEKHCEIKERKVSGATTTFRIVCGPPEFGELKGQFTRKGDRVEGRYTMTRGGESKTAVATGRKLGTCDPSKRPQPAGKQ